MNKTKFLRDIEFTRILFWAYLVLLFWLPIPLGSNRPWWWALAAGASALLLSIWAVATGLNITKFPRSLRRARWPLVLLALFVGWVGVQWLPGLWVQVPLQAFMPGDAILDISPDVATITTDRQATADSLLKSVGIISMALLTLVLVRSRRRARQVLSVLVLAGVLQAIYGSLMTLSGVEYGFFEVNRFGRGVATGTFVNRNHYANLLVLCLGAGIGLLICKMNMAGGGNWRQRLRGLVQAMLGQKGRLRIYLALMVIALVLTRSRMGNASFFIALLVVGVIALICMKKPSRPLTILILSLIAVDIFLVGTWFGVEQVIDRIQKTVEVRDDEWVIHAEDRMEANREALSVIRRVPMTGTGGGTFYSVFPMLRSSNQAFMDHVHNDYLQFAAEYGIPAMLVLFALLALMARRVIYCLRRPHSTTVFGVAFASSIALVAMAAHATVDFNLQIYANAGYFTVLCFLPFCLEPRGAVASE